jgi:hypothetical protein
VLVPDRRLSRRWSTSPRAGGEAAKFGDRFEGRWTVRYLLDVLLGRVDAVTVEPVDPLADHIEFFVDRNGEIEGHQAKRQVGNAANWTVPRLDGAGILAAAKAYADSGRRFSFVSTIPAQPLGALVDAARRADDYPTFSGLISGNSTQRATFDALAGKWGGPLDAWAVLRHLTVWKPDERDLQHTNAAIAQLLFQGPPDAATATLAAIAADTTGVPLTADRLWREAQARGLVQNPLWDAATVADRVSAQTMRFLNDAHARLFQPPLDRAETAEIVGALNAGQRLVLAAGAAGGGKSAVVAAVVDSLIGSGAAVLALRLDSFMDTRSSRQLGDALDLPASPGVALARASAGRQAVLVIDQVDAASLASGRAPEVLTVVEEVLGEASRLGVHVVLACRRYDIDNDPRLKTLAEGRGPQTPEVIEIAALTDDEVGEALAGMGVDPVALRPVQRDLLRLPLNLALLQMVLGDSDALTFATAQDLLAGYWRLKRRAALDRRPSVRFDRVVEVLVNEMSGRQTLALPEQVLHADGLDDDLDVLASEHLVVCANKRVTFFHETLFDYAFARNWTARGETMVAFLAAGEQELFRRAQVRQVLLYLREFNRSRFANEAGELLNDTRIRFHIKDSVFAILRGLVDPTTGEVQLLAELLASDSPWQARAEGVIRTSAWFNALDSAGLLNEWLSAPERELNERAITVIAQAGREGAARAANLLALTKADPEYAARLLWVIRFIDVDGDRGLFDLLLEAVRDGTIEDERELFTIVHNLGDAEPEWGVDLLAAWLDERPNAHARAEGGQVNALKSSDYGLNELIQKSAEGAPEAFIRRLLPYMQRVMAEAEQGDDLPRRDWHFSSQLWAHDLHDVDDTLMHYMVRALKSVAECDPQLARSLVEPLADDIHAAAQDLLYETLAAAGASHADWAAELLLRGDAALRAGYSGSYYWRTRELLFATSPHMSDDNFGAVEALAVHYEPDWEKQHPPSRGEASFVLLSGLAEARLSEAGRRKLGELRRKFNRDQPEQPRGIVGGFVGPPIPGDRAEHMNDEQWFGAMRKHSTDEGNWTTFELRGGAYELSHVLKAVTEREPDRFARLARRIDASYNRHYLEAILMGLGDTQVGAKPDLAYSAMRHAAAVGGQDRWIAQPLKALMDEEVPHDIVELVLSRALGVRDLADLDPTDAAAELPHDMGDPFTSGSNTARGGNVYALTRLVAFDRDGRRAAIIAPQLARLAADPSPEVRVCVAELIWVMLRWDRDAALTAFGVLVRDRAPALLTSNAFGNLMFAVIISDVARALPLAEEMRVSSEPELREHGARFLALAAIEASRLDLLPPVVDSDAPEHRRGAALILAARLRWSADPAVAEALTSLFRDPDESVREAAATFAGNIRGESLTRFQVVVGAFIASPAATDLTQLLFTLEHAPQPEHELVLQLAYRMVAEQGAALGDIRTHAAGDARHLTQLVLRSYSISDDPAQRRKLLDIVDRLLEAGAYGTSEAIDELRR